MSVRVDDEVARENGLDVGAMLDVIGAGLAGSEVLRQKRTALARDDFTASGPAKFLVKDLRFAAEAGGDLQLPELGVTRALFDGQTADGLGDQDNSVVLEYLRRRSARPT